jgi:hypothetical protein
LNSYLKNSCFLFYLKGCDGSMRKNDNEVTHEWRQYQAGLDYNHKINLYETVNKNERMYARRSMAGRYL